MNQKLVNKFNVLKIFSTQSFYLHLIYWIFYILFFTVQRFAYYNYSGFIENLQLNIIYLPNVLFFTYITTEKIIPRLFFGNKISISIITFIIILFIEPFVAYLIRSYIIEPYIYQDTKSYNLYNYLTAMLIFVFGIVPVASLKIFKLLRQEFAQRQKIEHDKFEAELKFKEAELKLLKGQIQPHFLFNTLNNLYSLSVYNSEKTPDVIMQISDLLSYITYECNSEKVLLEKEIAFIKTYIELEKLRFDENLNIKMNISGDFQNIMIAPLILQCFIENSFKHGASKLPENQWIELNLFVRENILYFTVRNNYAPSDKITNQGVGIENVKKKLSLIYPDKHKLIIENTQNIFGVNLEIQL